MEHPFFLSAESRQLRGQRRAVAVNAPPAGQQWSATPPGGTQWRVLGGTALLTNSIAVGNRFPGVRITLQGTVVYENFFNNNLAASAIKTILYMQNPTMNLAATQSPNVPVLFEPFWLSPGDTIASLTTGFDVADAYTNVSLVVEEVFYTNPQLEIEHRERDQRRAAEDAALASMLTGPAS